MADSAIDYLQAARLKFDRDYPYVGLMTWNLQFVEAPGLDTVGIDDRLRFNYDPKFVVGVGAQGIEYLTILFYHEVCGHILREHLRRGQPYEGTAAMSPTGQIFSLFNIAGDLEINDDKDIDVSKLPQGGLHPKQYGFPEGLLAEEYMELLLKQPGAKVMVKYSSVGSGACGKIAGGQPGEVNGEDEEGKVPPGISPAEVDLLRRGVAEKILEHAKSRGGIPGSLTRWAEAYTKVVVDWRNELPSLIRRCVEVAKGKLDYTYSQMSRRQSALGELLFPGTHAPQPNILFQVDTSGSMDDKLLGMVIKSIVDLIKALDLSGGLTVIATDATVQRAKKVQAIRDLELAGGGGTDMGKGFEYAQEMRPMPDILITVTDGETPWPQIEPPFDVMTVIIGGGGQGPAYGKTIRVEE